MKIAMVSINAGPLAWLGGVDGGGQSVLIDCLSGALARLGHDVTIYTRREDPALPSCLTTTSGVHVHHLEITVERAGSAGVPEILEHIAAFETRLTDEWRRDPPHIAHAHGWTSGRAAIGAARALRLPVVATFHGLGTVKPPRRDGGEPALRVAAEAQVVRDSVRLVATCSAEVFGLLRMGASPGAMRGSLNVTSAGPARSNVVFALNSDEDFPPQFEELFHQIVEGFFDGLERAASEQTHAA